MTENADHGLNETILAAEASILKISEELARMKRASDLLEDAGQHSQQLRDATGRLVAEIGILVESSGQIMTAMNQVDMKGVVSELRADLMQRLDGLEAEVKSGIVEQVKAGDDALVQRLDALGSQEAKTASELRAALTQRLDGLEAEVKSGIVEQVKAGDNALVQRLDALGSQEAKTASELRAALTQRLDGLEVEVKSGIVEQVKAGDDVLVQRLDALDSYVAETRSLVEQWSKRKGILF